MTDNVFMHIGRTADYDELKAFVENDDGCYFCDILKEEGLVVLLRRQSGDEEIESIETIQKIEVDSGFFRKKEYSSYDRDDLLQVWYLATIAHAAKKDFTGLCIYGGSEQIYYDGLSTILCRFVVNPNEKVGIPPARGETAEAAIERYRNRPNAHLPKEKRLDIFIDEQVKRRFSEVNSIEGLAGQIHWVKEQIRGKLYDTLNRGFTLELAPI